MKRSITNPDDSLFRKTAVKTGVVLFWLAAWHFLAMMIPLLLASPAAVFVRLCQLVVTDNFWHSVGFTLCRIALGFFVTVILGTLFAMLAHTLPFVRALMSPLVSLVGNTPVAAISIICLAWIGSRNVSVFIAALMAFPVLYTGILTGLDDIDPKLAEMAHTFQIRGARRFLYLTVSQVMPFFISAVKVSLGLCWKAGVAAEVIGIPSGSLGERLYEAKLFFNMPSLFAWTAVIILISVIFERMFMLLLRYGSKRLAASTCATSVRRRGAHRQDAEKLCAPTILLRGISKSFSGKTALRKVDMTFPAGSVTVLMGPSGCGKTTLLNLILGLLKPDEGNILFSPSGACAASESPATLSPEVKAAAVYQEDRLIESLTAAANIQLACPRCTRAEVLEALDALGLAADADTSVSTLSGGMRRRVALARALLFPSALLALDEAFDGLDSVTRDRVIDYAKTQLRGRTVVMVTHTAEEAVRIGGAVVQL